MTHTVAREFSRLARSLLGVALSLLAMLKSGHAQVSTAKATGQPDAAAIRPFNAHVPNSILIDLKRRLADAKWPDQLPGTSWEYGADIKYSLQQTATDLRFSLVS